MSYILRKQRSSRLTRVLTASLKPIKGGGTMSPSLEKDDDADPEFDWIDSGKALKLWKSGRSRRRFRRTLVGLAAITAIAAGISFLALL